MSPELLRALPTRPVALHVAAALTLVAAAWGGLDDPSVAVLVLRGVAVLLAAALALAVDEPSAALLDASPTPMADRVAARLTLCALVVLPCWAVALTAPATRGTDVPVTDLTLELVALSALGLAAATALRRWWRISEPALVAGPLLLGVLLAADQLPAALTLLPHTPLDPAWAGAHARWLVLLLAAGVLLRTTLADPSTARTARRLR